MAEVKNNFLGAKMNKDVDPRIMPNGEYRNALNLQINKSEGSSVGDLQTSLGNELILDFEQITGVSGLQCIGNYRDEKSNSIILFLTSYYQQPGPITYSPGNRSYIYLYNELTGLLNLLVEGSFLNFSITNPIIGVNLLEDLLFFTDYRNQPRKINVVTAQQTPGYYKYEEQISVAKYYPYQPIELYKISTVAPTTDPPTYETTMYDVVSEYLPDNGGSAKNTATTTGTIFVLSNYTTGFKPTPHQTVTGIGIVGNPTVVSFDVLTNEVELNTTQTIAIDVVLSFNPNPYYNNEFIGDPNFLQDKFVRFGYRFKFDDGEYSIFSPFTQTTFIPKQDGYFKRTRNPEDVSAPTSKATDTIQGSTGVSAGYVIKFEDNLIVPLAGQLITNVTWISSETYVVEWNPPFLTMSKPAIAGAIPNRTDFQFTTIPPNWINDDQEYTYKSTIVEFMQNKVNEILLRIPLPSEAQNLGIFNITQLDILYKESDGLSVSVVDSIPISKIVETLEPTDTIYEYVYDSKKPFKTLPEGQLTRVYDKVPIKALAQEIIGNRVVYGNYQDRATYPIYLDYNVKYSEKSVFNASTNVDENRTSIIEYPNHSLKQSRTYQVGIVLADVFGRQSGVILSNSTTGQTVEDAYFIAASLFVPYRTVAQVNAVEGNAVYFPGYSLKILFNSIIPDTAPDPSTGWPGLWKGKQDSPGYNPLGWFSYKIVVKQVQQDYYNVYLPGALAGYPVEPFVKELGKTSHIVLLNDNINKVPRDLKEVGPTQSQFRSSVRLYGRVENNVLYNEDPDMRLLLSVGSNAQYYPVNTFLFANTIATTESLFGVTSTTPTYPFQALYQVNSNPLVARLSTPAIFGVLTTNAATNYFTANEVISLAVLETEPVQSLLDIYWETTTAGLISDLNERILEGSNSAVGTGDFDFNLTEADDLNTIITGRFYFVDYAGNPIMGDVMVENMLVTNLLNTPRTSDFMLTRIPAGDISNPNFPASLPYDTFYLETTTYFYYGFNSALEDSFRFRFTVVPASGSTNDVVKLGNLTNIIPEITYQNPGNSYPTSTVSVHRFGGLNGSNIDGGVSNWDQQWSITSCVDQLTGLPAMSVFYVTNNVQNNNLKRGEVRFNFSFPSGDFSYNLKLRLTDAGGMHNECNMNIYNAS